MSNFIYCPVKTYKKTGSYSDNTFKEVKSSNVPINMDLIVTYECGNSPADKIKWKTLYKIFFYQVDMGGEHKYIRYSWGFNSEKERDEVHSQIPDMINLPNLLKLDINKLSDQRLKDLFRLVKVPEITLEKTSSSYLKSYSGDIISISFILNGKIYRIDISDEERSVHEVFAEKLSEIIIRQATSRRSGE